MEYIIIVLYVLSICGIQAHHAQRTCPLQHTLTCGPSQKTFRNPSAGGKQRGQRIPQIWSVFKPPPAPNLLLPKYGLNLSLLPLDFSSPPLPSPSHRLRPSSSSSSRMESPAAGGASPAPEAPPPPPRGWISGLVSGAGRILASVLGPDSPAAASGSATTTSATSPSASSSPASSRHPGYIRGRSVVCVCVRNRPCFASHFRSWMRAFICLWNPS